MYLYSYPSTHGISGLAPGCAWEHFKVNMNIMMDWTPRYIPTPWLSQFGDVLAGHNRVSLEMQLEAMIERTSRCTLTQWSSDDRDAIAGRDWVCLQMHLEAMIEWTQRCTPRLWSSVFEDALAGCDRARLEEYLEVVDLEAVTGRRCKRTYTYAWRQT